MRRRALALFVSAPLVVAVAASTLPRAPKPVNIVAACNPSTNPSVEPQRRDMTRQDHVEWREQSGRATSWMITPKNPGSWPFADTIRGDADTLAATSLPADDAQVDLPYEYKVTITCQNGDTQVIDPEIVIGGN